MNKLAHEELTGRIIACAIAVHKALGPGFLESIYETSLVVELKAISELEDIHFAIVRSYLKALGLEHGLLLNFATMPLTVKRVIFQPGS